MKTLENSTNNLNKVFKQALNYLHFSESSISEAADNQELSSNANVVESFEKTVNNSEKVLDKKLHEVRNLQKRIFSSGN